MFVVAGATGRVGSVVADVLSSRQEQVRVIVRRPEQAGAWHDRGADVAVGSLDDPRFLERALTGAKGFFALVPEDPEAADFHGHRRNIADALSAAVHASGVPHTVLLSALAASLAEGNGPAKDLHYAEEVLGRTKTTLTTIRATYFQDNAAAMVPAVQHDGIFPVFVEAIDEPFPMIATRDVGRFAAGCLVEPSLASEVVDLVGPPSSMRDVGTKLGALLGRSDVAIVPVPAEKRAGALAAAGLPRAFAEALAELYACFDSRAVEPCGDRMVPVTTTLDTTLEALVARAARRSA
jgi:uncharacterized protein YbjT (DUF2867 family)